MQPYERAAQARRELDRKYAAGTVEAIQVRPHSGWIRAIREALDMSQTVLARCLGISRGSVNKLEHAEVHGGITINKLAEVAAAFDCHVVYAIVPNHKSLEQVLLDHATAAAEGIIRYTARTMELEDQAIGADRQREALERHAQELIRSRHVWDTP